MNIWLQFLICTGVIVFAGAKLSKYGDIIADITGLGRTWIGVVLMATVTSLPELITGASSVVVYDLPDIAAGDIFGSCIFNVAILAILDFLHKKPLTAEANAQHALAGAFGIILLATAAIAIFLRDNLPSLGWIGLSSPLFIAFYFAAMRLIFIQQQQGLLQDHGDYEASDVSKSRVFTIYGVHALIVIAAASWLPTIGDRIAQQTGLGHTFVGSLFIGLSTSLPEFVVTYTAVRRGAVNMAVGNLLGSNLFNIAILAIDDLLYTEGPLLAAVEGHHVVTACGAILVTGFAVIGLTYRSEKKYLRFGLDSLAIMTAFVAVTFLLYRLRSG
jgi:cation:H+ antiporter